VDSAQGWLPEQLRWYTTIRGDYALNCGILGGNRLDFIRCYADLAIRLVEHPLNRAAWSQLGDRFSENLIAEQYLLAACVEYSRARADSPHHELGVECLFGSMQEAFDPTAAARAGFTHLIGLAKSDPELAQRLEARVRRDYPHYYERCVEYLESNHVDR
jgi:hypothetical protein